MPHPLDVLRAATARAIANGAPVYTEERPPLDPTPPVSGRYGAPMGRTSHPVGEVLSGEPIRVCRVFLESDYDAGGAYWGGGTPLYYLESFNGDVCDYIRASDTPAAFDHIRERFPGSPIIREPDSDIPATDDDGEPLDPADSCFVPGFDPAARRSLIGYIRHGFDHGDPWGESMSWAFDVAGEMSRRGLDIPDSLGYSPGAGGPEVSEDRAGELSEFSAAALDWAARVLSRYIDRLDAAGRSY